MTSVPSAKDSESRLLRLERAVRALERRSTLGSASISGGNLTVRGGGSIVVRDGGGLTGLGDGNLDWDGDAHFGGNLLIDGDTTLGGDLEFAPGVIPPAALSYRTEAKTFGSFTGPIVSSNTFTANATVTVPDWAEHTSVVVLSSVYFIANARANATAAIDGNSGPITSAYTDTQTTFPAMHRRDFAPAAGSSFNVVVSGGAAPISATPTWEVNIVVMTVFTN